MARSALFAKPAIVDVLMAAFTIAGEQILKNVAALFVVGRLAEGFAGWLMTFDALHIQVQPLQYKAGDGMVERFASGKLGSGMAFTTGPVGKFLMKLALVFVFMASLTVAFGRVGEQKK